ncbi:MAG: hypothetical protein RL322_346 [Pseudomonadota bacterium]
MSEGSTHPILGRSAEPMLDLETDMSILSRTPDLPADTPPATTLPDDPLALITHPERALDAARRMAAHCRNGLRFYSDFRRVRALDEIPEGEEGDEAFEVYDELSHPDGASFDPAFRRR